MDFFKFKKNHTIGLIISIIVCIILSLLYSKTRIFDTIEAGTVDFRFFLRDPSQKSKKLMEGIKQYIPNARANKDIIILGIDENTIRDFSDQGIKWPFSWDVHAKFTRFIGSGHPLAILFDIMFIDHKQHEKELASAIKEAGSVYLDFPFETEEVETQYKDQKKRLALFEQFRWPADPLDTIDDLVAEPTPPLPILIKAARGIGFANIFPDAVDNINRTMPLILKFKGWYYPNIDLIIVMRYFGITLNDVEIKWGQYIKLKNIPLEKMKKPNKNREIVIPVDKRGFLDVNFIGGPGSFRHYSYNLFYRDGTMGTNTSLKDKIIMVAAYAATGIATDEKQSPYGATFGIEHHANALNTILNQDFLYRLTILKSILLILVIALLLGFILPRVSIIFSALFTGFFSIVYIISAYLLFDQLSIIIPFSIPVIQTGMTFTLIITYRLVSEQKEKKVIRQTFSKFVSKSVVDDLLKHPEKVALGGEKKVLTVLFSDIRGFTSISEKLTPELLVEHLNNYLQAMTDIVIKYFGTLDKYVGDEIMAFWGAPIPQENHAILACRAGLEMMVKLHAMNKDWIVEGKPPMNIGIGLNTGDMVVGNMGSASRMDYTLMGDSVNLGARLEGTNKIYKTNVIISEYTYEHVKDQVIVRELDLIRVKGKELPVKIYELLEVKEGNNVIDPASASVPEE